MNPPFAVRRPHKAATGLFLVGSFAVGVAVGFGLVAAAFGRDLFDRYIR